MEAIRRSRGSADYQAASGVMRDILVRVVNESYEDELARIACPVALVWGENDFDVPLAVAERAQEILLSAGSAVDLSVLPGIGHLTPTEAPLELARMLDRIRP